MVVARRYDQCGAATGATVGLLNHAAERIQDGIALRSFAKKMFGSDYKQKYGVKSLKWGSEMGNDVPGASYNSKNGKLYVGTDPTAGITTPDRRIYIADGIKAYGLSMLEGIVGHEFVHSYQRMTFGSNYNQGYSEYSAYQYSIDFSLKHNLDSRYLNFFKEQQSTYPKSPAAYNYKRIPGL